MKKLWVFLLTILLLSAMVIPAFAAEEALSVSNMNVQAGDTAYLRVTLNESVKGDSLGISYSFDSNLLKALPKLCTWEKKGAIQDFNNKKAGAWAATSATDLKGELCVLAFEVRDGVSFSDTKVTCTVTVKNGTKVAGEYTATGTISMVCEHSYGDWADDGDVGHVKTCGLCGGKTTESHAWDEGKIVEGSEEEHVNLKIRTCTVCGAEKQEKVAAELEQYEPTNSKEPTVETTEPIIQMIPSGTTAATHPHHEEEEPEIQTMPTYPRETVPETEEEETWPVVEDEYDHGGANSDEGKPGTSENGPQNNHQDKNDKNNKNEGTEESKPSSYVDYNDPIKITDDGVVILPGHEGHDHSYEEDTVPMIVPGNGVIEGTETTEHVHEEHEEAHFGAGGAVALVVLLGLIVVLPICMIRGKKKI